MGIMPDRLNTTSAPQIPQQLGNQIGNQDARATAKERQ